MDSLDKPTPYTVSLVDGRKVEVEASGPVPWLWKPYLAFGTVSILDGDPGVGKSLFTIDLAARIGTAKPMPDGSPAAVNPVKRHPIITTIFVNAEDSVRYTLVPRLLAAGGESLTAFFVGGIGEASHGPMPLRFPENMNYLTSLIMGGRTRLDGSLLVLDPMMALFPKAAASSDAVIRGAIDPLVRLAAESHCCVLLVRHLNKSASSRSMYRGGGSIGIVGACRTGLLVGPHPDDPERRVLSMTKSNMGPLGPSLGFRIVTAPARTGRRLLVPGEKHPETGEVIKKMMVDQRAIPEGPVIQWDGPTPITADDLCSAKPDFGGQSSRAAEWLKKLLANGPVPATVVEAKAQEERLAYRTVQFVKKCLNVESRLVVEQDQRRWEWSLPAEVIDP
jgi:hypothetical protein